MSIFTIMVVLMIVFGVIRAAKMQKSANSTKAAPAQKPQYNAQQNAAYQKPMQPSAPKASKQQRDMWGDEARYFDR